jgi:hypothetical protein
MLGLVELEGVGDAMVAPLQANTLGMTVAASDRLLLTVAPRGRFAD